MKSRWLNWRLLSLVMGMALVLSGCGRENLSALVPKGPVAEQQFFLMGLTSAIMIGVFIIVMIIFAYVLIRYRRRPGQTGIPKQVEGSHKLEILWTVVPFLLLIVMAVPTVAIGFDLAKEYSNKEAVQVNVTAHQFWWEFEYPDLGVRTAQELFIPAGKKIQFNVTSADVVHAFWVPALGGKIDTNPGMTNKIWLQADEPGTYYGKCAELCGASHALMDFKVQALEASAFDAWAKKMKAATEAPAPVPSATATATANAQQGYDTFKQSCIGCHAIGSEGGKLGPNLTNFGERLLVAGIRPNNKEELAAWLKNPQEVKPGNTMPNLNLNDEQVNALVEYLSTLKVTQ